MQPINRERPTQPFRSVDEATAADRAYFDANPGEEEYIREFVPGEFGGVELPEIPPGFRYATIVSVTLRDDSGTAIGRYRRLMAVCDDPDAMRALQAPAA